jgi:hypothetical protein
MLYLFKNVYNDDDDDDDIVYLCIAVIKSRLYIYFMYFYNELFTVCVKHTNDNFNTIDDDDYDDDSFEYS